MSLRDCIGDNDNRNFQEDWGFINFWFNKKTLRICEIWDSYKERLLVSETNYQKIFEDSLGVDRKYYLISINAKNST